MKILITGSSGFLGSHLKAKLEKKHKVIGYEKNELLPVEPVDLVYHLAGNSKVLTSIIEPYQAFENILFTFTLLDWMKTKKVKKIIFASSTATLSTPYGASKKASENLIEAFCNSYGIGAVSLRFSNIYGPGDKTDRFIPTVIRQAQKDGEIRIYGKKGSFVFIDDCIKIFLRAKTLLKKEEYQIYEIKGEKASLVSIAEKIKKLVLSKSKITLENGLKRCIT